MTLPFISASDSNDDQILAEVTFHRGVFLNSLTDIMPRVSTHYALIYSSNDSQPIITEEKRRQ